MSTKNQILLLGAGELGTAVLAPLSQLSDVQITLAVRSPDKYKTLKSSNVALLSIDTDADAATLAPTFSQYDTIISCTGFTSPLGTQLKLAEAVLLAGKQRKQEGKGKVWYFPWQWGVDYDITRDAEGTMPLFGEQLEARNLLRKSASDSNVSWTIVSTGIFMSFLFEKFWGVVEPMEGTEEVVVRALGSWENRVTVTTVEDIGKIAAAIVGARDSDVEVHDRVLFAAGATISYAKVADIVRNVTEKKVNKELWDVPFLREQLAKDPEDLLKKYRVVFARGEGVAWDEQGTINQRLGVKVTDVETWAKIVLNI